MGRNRILFLYEHDVPFVASDLAILRERFDVDPLRWEGSSSTRLLHRVRDADASFSWFALGYAARAVFLGKILGRASVVVSGGWDVVSMPEIAYGAARSRRGRIRARFALRNADRVLATSDWSRQTIEALSGRTPDLLYPGVDLDRFGPRGPRENLVVTVGNVTRENFARKGLEPFVRAAAQMPDVRFQVIGRHDGDAGRALSAIATPNVELTGWVPEEDLRDRLARAKVYVQVSYNEGFGLALAEAMASGCVPVVTRAGSLPEVVGDVGYYVPFNDPGATAAAIRDALASNRSSAARERIATLFPLSGRRKRLHALMEALLGG